MELLFALELLFIMFELLFELLVTKIVLSWSNAPYQRCSSGTYGIGMVQCSVIEVPMRCDQSFCGWMHRHKARATDRINVNFPWKISLHAKLIKPHRFNAVYRSD